MNEASGRQEFPLVAGQLALDFLNTRVMRGGTEVDLLCGFDDLVEWSQAAGIAGPETTERFVTGGLKADRDKAFALALEVRDGIRTAVECLSRGRAIPQATVGLLNELLRERTGCPQLVPGKAGIQLAFRRKWSRPEHLLAPVVEAAAELLADCEPALIRQCEAPDCILYFYDTTRNHRRRWCSMGTCGNRAKAAAHYRRRRGQSASQGEPD